MKGGNGLSAYSAGSPFVMPKTHAVSLAMIDYDIVAEMLKEYAENNEECKPMNFKDDPNTLLMAVMNDEDKLVGVVRFTTKLWHECHGNVGVSIRPSERNKGYGRDVLSSMKLFIKAMANRFRFKPKACIDEKNEVSIRLFEEAGWVRTGRKFDWKMNRKAVEFVHE